jgi:hypothetical protein
MTTKEVTYEIETYNAVKAFLIGLPIFCGLVAFVIGVGRYLQNEAFVIIGWISICAIPFLFQKKFKKIFTYKLVLDFSIEYLLIREYSLKNARLSKESKIPWTEIRAYKFYVSASGTTYLNIYLRNGPARHLSFKENKDQKAILYKKSAFSIFYYFVSDYNSREASQERIQIEPGFFTTRSGEYVLYSLIILSVIAVTLHLIFSPRTSMFSFVGVFITLGLLAKRRSDKLLYNLIAGLEPRSPFVE